MLCFPLNFLSLSRSPNRKQRLASSSDPSPMDLGVVEIAPPPVSSKLLKRKEVILHEVIDLDEDEDSTDNMMYGMEIDARNKGKAIKSISNGYSNHQAKESYSNTFFGPGGMDTISVNGVGSSKSFAPGSNFSINLGSHSSNSYHEADKYIDLSTNDIINVDDYEILQSQFDKVDIPTGVEALLPGLPDLAQIKNKAVNSIPMQSNLGFPLHGIDYPSTKLSESSQLNKMLASVARAAASKPSQNSWEHQFSKQSYQFSQFLEPSLYPNSSSSSLNQVLAMKSPPVADIPMSVHGFPNHLKKQRGSNLPYSDFPSQMGPLNHQPGENTFSWFNPFRKHKKASVSPSHPGVSGPFDGLPISSEEADKHRDREYAGNQTKISGAGAGAEAPDSNSHVGQDKYLEVVLAKFRYFKQFDTADNHSDHHYTTKGSSTKQPSKVWAKRIQDEWKIVEKDLPDTIFVRVYESRMDILRAVIKGAEGTPYHDGLFFFDVFFPSDYPNTPPHVHYHAGGLRLNPNLYACGKVCLSLLNTWNGNKNEKWIPGKSSMLQVLVSIQGLILNSKPYFNEPGYERSSGTTNGEKNSLKYNEDTFILSLRTMSYTMRKPPKHFEDFVVGHFCERAHDILVACKAYIDGAQVGCLVKGGVQDVDEGDKSCSAAFKKKVAEYVPVLVKGFKGLGAKDCEKFLPPSAETRSSKHRCAGWLGLNLSGS